MAPTSIDGTDIVGATIDGEEVQQITANGDIVFELQSLPDGAIHIWPMDEGSGTVANDSVSTADISLSGVGWTSDANSKGGFATVYNGSSDYGVISNRSSFSFTSSFTIRYSAYFHTVNDFDTTIAKGEGNGVGGRDRGEYCLGLSSNSQIQFQYFDNANIYSVRGDVPTSGTWYEIAGRYDENTGTISLYVDGIEEGTLSGVGTPQNEGNDLYFGKDGYRNDFHFNGEMDWPVMWDRALSDSEMSDVTTLR